VYAVTIQQPNNYWTFDEITGKFVDIKGGVNLNEIYGVVNRGVVGKVNKSVEFRSGGAARNYTAGGFTSFKNFSLNFWANFTGTSGRRDLWSFYRNVDSRSQMLMMFDGAGSFSISNQTLTFLSVSTSLVPIGKWTMITVRYNRKNGTAEFFVNGTKKGSTISTINNVATYSTHAVFGNIWTTLNQDNNFKMDEATWWQNKLLSNSEISALYSGCRLSVPTWECGSSVNSSVTTTPILSDITGTQTTLFYTNIINYQNNTANQRIVWTVNSTSGTVLKNATNATGRFLNCSSYPQCKGGSTIYARGITEKGVSKSSYSAAKSVYIFPDFVRVDFTNLTYLPLNNSWHDGSFNMYFKPVSNSNPMNCTLFKNATLNTVKENLTANVTTFFLIGTNAGELSNNSYYIVCAAAKEYASGIMTGTSNSKTMLVDMVNPIINIWTPSADLQRFYQTININVTIQNFLINNVYMKVYDSASTLTYDYTSNYGIYLKNYLKSYVMSNFTGSKHEGFVQIYARDYVNKTSNYTRHFYVMNCTQLSESWSTNYLQPCQITDTRTYNYADANSCNTYIDNVTNVNQVINGSCNYCTSTYSYIDSACSNGIFQRTYSYTNPCCSITSLSSDCNIPSNQNYSCSIPVNIVGLGAKEVLGETGHGLGSFASGMMSGGGIVKLIMGVLIIVAMVALVLGVAYVAKESIRKL
jgi:hypothetical protein